MTDRNNMQIQSCILDLHTPVLTGPRQVGKTTLLTKMAGEERKLVYSGLAYLGSQGLRLKGISGSLCGGPDPPAGRVLRS